MPGLDIERFRKVKRLMEEGATAGERSAAKARAEAMARSAGVTLQEAIARCGTVAKKPTTSNFFADFSDWMEEREPGYKARRAAERAEKERKDDIRRREVLREYGSESALFRRTPWEEALLHAVEPISVMGCWTDQDGERHIYPESIEGRIYDFVRYEEITPAVMAAVSNAYPIPSRLNGVFLEHRTWRRLEMDRDLFCRSGEWNHYQEVRVRIAILENELYTRPVQNWGDMQSRLQWWQVELEWEMNNLPIHEQSFKDRIAADLEILRDLDILRDPNVDRRRASKLKGKRRMTDPRQPDLFPP